MVYAAATNWEVEAFEMARKVGTNGKEIKRSEPTPEEIAQGKAFGDWFRNALRLSGMRVYNVAVKTGRSTAYLYTMEKDCIEPTTGFFKKPSERIILEIAEATGADANRALEIFGYPTLDQPQAVLSPLSHLPIDAQQALAKFVEMLPNSIQSLTPTDSIFVPLIGSVSAGTPIFATENIRERIPVPRRMVQRFDESHVFAVRVRGDCLTGLLIASGDLLICRQADMAKDGDIVVVVSDEEEAVAKRFREDPVNRHRWLETVPISGTPEIVHLNGTTRIIGIKVGLYREG